MKNVVAFSHALADETRWRIALLIFSEPMCVCELADILGMPQSSVSSHVQVIKKAGILESEKREKWIYYRLSPGHRHLVMMLAEFFNASPAWDSVLKADASRAQVRLAEREESCCPLPQGLKKLKAPAFTARPGSKTKIRTQAGKQPSKTQPPKARA